MTLAASLRALNRVIIAAGLITMPLSAPAQAWKPERPVEIMVGCAPGCGPDVMARQMQRIFQANRYFETLGHDTKQIRWHGRGAA